MTDNKTNTPINFKASVPPHVERNTGASKQPNNTTAFAVPGEVPAKANPGGSKSVPGKFGPQ